MKGWVGLVGCPTADGLPITNQSQVRWRPLKISQARDRRSTTELRYTTNNYRRTKVETGALDRVHNSRRPCSSVSLSGDIATFCTFCTFWPSDLDLWPFDLILSEVSWWTISLLNLAILVLAVFVLSCGHTHIAYTDTQTEPQTQIYAILTQLPSAYSTGIAS